MEYQVLDMKGEVIFSKSYNSNRVSIEVSEWASGTYIIYITTKSGVLMERVVVI